MNMSYGKQTNINVFFIELDIFSVYFILIFLVVFIYYPYLHSYVCCIVKLLRLDRSCLLGGAIKYLSAE